MASVCLAALAIVGGCAIDEQTVFTAPLEGEDPPFEVPPQPTGELNGPDIVDHWHVAYGFYNCDAYESPIRVEDDPEGIHSHIDGVIHIHPFRRDATYERATLGKFFEASSVEASGDAVVLPDSQGQPGDVVLPIEGECGGEPARLYLIDFGSVDVLTDPVVRAVTPEAIADTFAGEDRTAIAIAFVSDPDTVPPPPSVPNLDRLSDVPPAPDVDDQPDASVEPAADAVRPVTGSGFQPVLQVEVSGCAPPLTETSGGECLGLGPAVENIVVESATAVPGVGSTGFLVDVVLTPDSMASFNETAVACFELSDRCRAGRLAIVVDGRVVSAPVVQVPSFERDAIQINGDFDRAEAGRIAAALGG